MQVWRCLLTTAVCFCIGGCGSDPSKPAAEGMMSTDQMMTEAKKVSRQQQACEPKAKQFITGLQTLQVQLTHLQQEYQKQISDMHNSNIQMFKQVQTNLSQQMDTLSKQIDQYAGQLQSE